MAVHVVLNQKGGVGKSTIAVNLAAVTADVLNHDDDPDTSSPVAAVSVDPQGSAVWWAARIDDLPFHIVQAHDDLDGLKRLGELPGIAHVYVDTPGWIDLQAGDDTSDPLGRGPAADALRVVLDIADSVIVPIETEPLSFDPTARTITKVIEPRGVPYTVVINNWDPRDGMHDLNETKEFVKANKWPLAHTVIRHYKLHARASADGQVVTEYPVNRVALQAREDFYKFALELNVGECTLMARGQRTNLASLANSVGDHSPVDQIAAAPSHSAALSELTPNPHNPRDDLGDLADLESIADIQLQPAVVVTKAAFLKLYPDDAVTARFVVINGCRRLAAAHKYGRTDLAIVINDDIARDRVTLISASIAENVDRKDFDVIEEAKAVEALVKECGSGTEAATRLRKTQAWVSQRRALLELAPQLQTALRRGELAIREARSLARVPLEQQVARWQAAQDKKDDGAHHDPSDTRPPSPSRIFAKALSEFNSQPQLLADALRTQLGPDGVKTLLAVLTDQLATA